MQLRKICHIIFPLLLCWIIRLNELILWFRSKYLLQDLRLSWLCDWGLKCSGMWHGDIERVVCDIPKDPSSFMFEGQAVLAEWFFMHDPSKCWELITQWHGLASLRTGILIFDPCFLICNEVCEISLFKAFFFMILFIGKRSLIPSLLYYIQTRERDCVTDPCPLITLIRKETALQYFILLCVLLLWNTSASVREV
jgi:hypothetical protein